MLSNHHHTVLYDRHGTINEFDTRFHGILARSQNALRKRDDHFWNNRGPSVVELLDPEAVMAKLVYTATNPVKHELVEKSHQWPGLNALAALRKGKTLKATRPKHFFREDGPMPAEVEVTFRIPPELGESSAVIADLTRRVDVEEKRLAEVRRVAGRGVLGRRRILRQSWNDAPSTVAPRCQLNPRFASKDRKTRLLAISAYQFFVRSYRRARREWLAGIPTVFPAGTYWLRRFMNVPTEPIV